MPERTKTAGVADARELAGWREFADRYLPRQASAKSGFVLFQARWRLAWSFERLGAPGYSGDVLDGYSIGFNLFHAYTAHEQLAKAVGRQHHDFPMEDAALAADVRKTLAGLHEPLLHEARPMQVELLSTFFGGGRERARTSARWPTVSGTWSRTAVRREQTPYQEFTGGRGQSR